MDTNFFKKQSFDKLNILKQMNYFMALVSSQ